MIFIIKKKSLDKELSRLCMISSLSLLKIILNKRCPIILRIHVIILQITSILLWYNFDSASNLLRFIDILFAFTLFLHCIYRFYKTKYLWENVDIPILFILNLINYKLKRKYIAYDLTFVVFHSIFHLRASNCLNNLINIKY